MTEVRRVGARGRVGAYLGALALGIVVSIAVAGGPEAERVDTNALLSRQLDGPDAGRTLGTPETQIPRALASVDESQASSNVVAASPADAVAAPTAAAAEPPSASSGGSTPAPNPAPAPAATAPQPDRNNTAAPKAAPAPTPPPTTRAPAVAPATTAAPAPTTRPPTTTTPPATDVLAFRQFTDWPIRNTSLDARTQFVDTPASQINWQSFTEGSDRAIQLGSVTANKHLGQFRTQCSFSHFAYDDPLVFPGQAGRAHLHMFFGNTEANAKSTYESLRDSGSSTCNGLEGNRTGYWVPAVFDSSGNARIPSRIEVYYKSHDRAFENVAQPPAGLGMVAGNASTNPNIEWACQETGAQGENLNRPVQQRQNTIPRCSGTATLLAHIKFPQCLSGSVGPRSGNVTHQLSYPTRGYFTNSCPPGTQYITAIEYFIAWAPNNHDGRTDQWWLSSDVRPEDQSRVANGSTLHGDWFGAWNPNLLNQIHNNCVARLAECSWDLVDNHRRLTWVEHFGPKHAAAYRGRRSIPASELSAALCPGDGFARAEDAAHCLSTMQASRSLGLIGPQPAPQNVSLSTSAMDDDEQPADDNAYVPFCLLGSPADDKTTTA